MSIERHSKRADSGWGNLYYGVISSIINKNNYKTFVEVGVAFGGHLEEILQNTKLEKAYAIDSYKLSSTTTDSFMKEDGSSFEQKDYDELYEFTKNRLSKFTERISFIREESINAVNSFKDNSIDIIFIDAEHSYNGVKNDIKNWLPKIKKGGILAGHDYNHPNFPGVKNAVVELLGNSINVERGYVWWINI